MNRGLVISVSIILFTIIEQSVYGQQTDVLVDNLYRELRETKADTTRSLLQAELSFLYYAEPDSCFKIATRGLTLAKSIGYGRGIAQNELSIGMYHYLVGDRVQAYKYFLKSMEWQLRYGNSQELARSHLLLGMAASEYLGVRKSIDYLKKSIYYYERANNSLELVMALNNIGWIYRSIKEYDSALLFLNKGLELTKETKQVETEAVLVQSIGELLIDKSDYKGATEQFYRSIKLNENFDKRIQAISYLKLASIFRKTNQVSESLRHAKISLEIARKSNNLPEIESSSRFLHEIYLEQKNFEKAIGYFKMAVAAHDSVYSLEKNKEIQKLQTNFDIKSKESEIKILQGDNLLKATQLQLNADHLKRQRVIVIALALGLIALIAAFVWYRMMSSVKRELEIERIRVNIARDLHDDIGSTLSSMQIISKLGCDDQTLQNAYKSFSLIEGHAKKMLDTMSDIVWSINSNNDTIDKMVLYMKQLSAEILEPQNIKYHFILSPDINNKKIDISIRKNLFLIFKEALNNAMKYSACDEIRITVSYHLGRITMEIVDNGHGFDFSNVRLGNGLNNMKERASAVGAQIVIKSEIGVGTGISVSKRLR